MSKYFQRFKPSQPRLAIIALSLLAIGACIDDPSSFESSTAENFADPDAGPIAECAPCETGDSCHVDADCLSGRCRDGVCLAPESCQVLADYALDSGSYVIEPVDSEVAPFEAHCDFDADRGVGYTMVRIDDDSLLEHQESYRRICEERGMELIVPRSRAHAEAILEFNDDTPPNLVGVYRQFPQARGLHNWEGRCQGQPCTFYLDDSNSAGCTDFEPSGTNHADAALSRAGDGCFFGAWRDDEERIVHIQGWVLCSTNDAGPEPRDSCLDYRRTDSVHNAGPRGVDGVYELRSGHTDSYSAHCDMTSLGGGWTLTMKIDGEEPTFLYDSPLWTNEQLFNPDAPALNGVEAKLQSFNELPFTQLLVGLETPKDTSPIPALRHLPLSVGGDSLREIFSGGQFRPTSVGRPSWRGLVAGGSLQAHCNREGLNNAVDGIDSEFSRVRVGLIANEQPDCDTPNSRIGLGSAGTSCGQENYSAGNTAACGADGGTVNTAGMGALFVRDIPVHESCRDLQDAGITRSGIYPIDPDGTGPFNVYCEMELAGGGWTVVAINGFDHRPTRWRSNEFPRPGAAHYGDVGRVADDMRSIERGERTAHNYSIDAAGLFDSSQRQILAFVGGTTSDYVTTTLPDGCNFFDGSGHCLHNTYTGLTVYHSDDTVLTEQAQACTSAPGLITDDPYDEFGLHLVDGTSADTHHCNYTDSSLGHQGNGRIYTTFENSIDTFWNNGVFAHWNEDGDDSQPGFLLLR